MNIMPVLLFAIAMTVTPGPNNMLLTVSGARFGFRKTLPLVTGITLGIVSQLILSAMGLSVLFERFPMCQSILKYAGTAYILYLAVRIAMVGMTGKEERAHETPMGLFQGMLFQYVNPKAYIMTISAVSVYSESSEAYLLSVMTIILVFAVVGPCCISLWAAFGTVLNKTLMSGPRQRTVQLSLGGITALSALFILL